MSPKILADLAKLAAVALDHYAERACAARSAPAETLAEVKRSLEEDARAALARLDALTQALDELVDVDDSGARKAIEVQRKLLVDALEASKPVFLPLLQQWSKSWLAWAQLFVPAVPAVELRAAAIAQMLVEDLDEAEQIAKRLKTIDEGVRSAVLAQLGRVALRIAKRIRGVVEALRQGADLATLSRAGREFVELHEDLDALGAMLDELNQLLGSITLSALRVGVERVQIRLGRGARLVAAERDRREALVGANVHANPLRVYHAELEALGEGAPSAFARLCPSCKLGTLGVCRHPETFELLRRDHCVLCGQVVIYEDQTIGGQRFRDGAEPTGGT